MGGRLDVMEDYELHKSKKLFEKRMYLDEKESY